MDGIISKTNPSKSEPLDETPLEDGQRARAKRQFYQIVDYFYKLEPKNQRDTAYNRPLLIRYTYEYARSQESRDVFFRSFFRSMGLSLDADDGSQEDNRLDLDSGQVESLSSVFFAFADYLLDNFFLHNPPRHITPPFLERKDLGYPRALWAPQSVFPLCAARASSETATAVW